MTLKSQYGTPFSATTTHATAAVASKAGAAGATYYITDIAASSDKAGAVLIVKQGTTKLWELQLGTTAAGIQAFGQHFDPALEGVVGGLVSVEIDGTSACKANINGYSIS